MNVINIIASNLLLILLLVTRNSVNLIKLAKIKSTED
jgi:hypothetical protein